MTILTHLIALVIGVMVGIGLIALLAVGQVAEDEHKDCWRDR